MTHPLNWEAGCLGKHGYPSPKIAHEVASNMRKRQHKKNGGKPVEVYRCRVCGLWKVGQDHSLKRKANLGRETPLRGLR